MSHVGWSWRGKRPRPQVWTTGAGWCTDAGRGHPRGAAPSGYRIWYQRSSAPALQKGVRLGEGAKDADLRGAGRQGAAVAGVEARQAVEQVRGGDDRQARHVPRGVVRGGGLGELEEAP